MLGCLTVLSAGPELPPRGGVVPTEVPPRGWVVNHSGPTRRTSRRRSLLTALVPSLEMLTAVSKGLEIAPRGWVITTQAPHDGRPVIAPCDGPGAVARDADSRDLARMPSKGLEIAPRGWVITTQVPHDRTSRRRSLSRPWCRRSRC